MAIIKECKRNLYFDGSGNSLHIYSDNLFVSDEKNQKMFHLREYKNALLLVYDHNNIYMLLYVIIRSKLYNDKLT